MSKRVFGFCAALCLLLAMVYPAFAAEETLPFDPSKIPYNSMVTDSAGLLTFDEAEELNAKAWELTKEYSCAVYIVTLPGLNGMEAWEANEYIVREYGMGYGPDQSCVVLLLSMEYRDYMITAHGYGNTAFTDYGKEKMAERFLDEFGEDDWYGGFSEYLDCCEEYLRLASEGEPFDVDSDSDPLFEVVISIVVSLIVAFVVCVRFEAQMKTAKMQKAARAYIDQRGLVLTAQSDRFLRTTRSERYIEPESSSSGGTTVNDSGFSHESGKF